MDPRTQAFLRTVNNSQGGLAAAAKAIAQARALEHGGVEQPEDNAANKFQNAAQPDIAEPEEPTAA
jgi:hypothetical protein